MMCVSSWWFVSCFVKRCFLTFRNKLVQSHSRVNICEYLSRVRRRPLTEVVFYLFVLVNLVFYLKSIMSLSVYPPPPPTLHPKTTPHQPPLTPSYPALPSFSFTSSLMFSFSLSISLSLSHSVGLLREKWCSQKSQLVIIEEGKDVRVSSELIVPIMMTWHVVCVCV